MAVNINDALIRKVADLARLDLKDEDIAGYVKSIGDILKHIDQLNEVNVEGVEPMSYGIDGALRLREDEVRAFPTDDRPGHEGKPKILKNAPEVMYDGFKVPPII